MFKIVQIFTILISQGKVILIWKDCIIYIEHRRLETVQNRSNFKKSPYRKGSKYNYVRSWLKKVFCENLVASDDPIHGFQNSAPDYADDYPMLGEINNVFSKLTI